MANQPQSQPSSSADFPHEQNPGGATPAEQELSADQLEFGKILRNIHHAPDGMGIVALGRDGVFRSLTADRDVVDAVPLPPQLIKAMLDRVPFQQELEDVYRGVDGTHVAREQWFNPDRALLPEPLSEEKKREAQKFHEENHEMIERNMERLRRGEQSGCGCVPQVISNYNLTPKTTDGTTGGGGVVS
jgi:hypothetical protein